LAYKWSPILQSYVGISTDTKPTVVDIGAILYEINLTTKIRKTYQTHDGGTTWTEISNGSQLSGSKIIEQLTQTDAATGVLTFTDNINAIEIYNTDATNDGVFEVNGINLNVPKGVLYRSNVGGTVAKTVTVSGSTTYIVSNLV